MQRIIMTLRKRLKRFYARLSRVLPRLNRVLRKLRKFLPKTRRQKRQLVRIGGAVALLILGIFMYNKIMTTTISPSAYTPLLNTIAKGESKGNYNAYFGNAANETIRFTDMTVDEVLKWQAEFVAQGSVSSAVGKYQIIRPTLAGLVKQLDLDTNQKFDKSLQDKMAITLIERRGAIPFVENALGRADFAANLSKEWAALPSVAGPRPEQSHYAGDGINKAHISVDEIFAAIDAFKLKANSK